MATCWRGPGGTLVRTAEGRYYLVGSAGAIVQRWLDRDSSDQEMLYEFRYTVEGNALIERMDVCGDGDPRPTMFEVQLAGLVAIPDGSGGLLRQVHAALEEEDRGAKAGAERWKRVQEERHAAFRNALAGLRGGKLDGALGEDAIELVLEPEYDPAKPADASPAWVVKRAGAAEVLFRAGTSQGKGYLDELRPIAKKQLGRRLKSFKPLLRTSRDDGSYYTD